MHWKQKQSNATSKQTISYIYNIELMGNTQKKPQEKSVSITTQHKQIILHYTYKIKLVIGYSSTFPHNFEGLKLWDANIALARYVVMNTHRLKNNSVLQLPTGTGIVGISVRKWTQAKKLVMVDYSDEVVGNAKNNCLKNKVDNYVAAKMRWDEYASFNSKYDVLLASDPFFHRCSPALMVKIAEHFLAPGGTLILAAPQSKNLQAFLKLSEEGKFEITQDKINSEEFMNSPTYNQVEGEKQFPQLCKGEILIYVLANKKYGKVFREEKQQMSPANFQKNIQIQEKKLQEKEKQQVKNKQWSVASTKTQPATSKVQHKPIEQVKVIKESQRQNVVSVKSSTTPVQMEQKAIQNKQVEKLEMVSQADREQNAVVECSQKIEQAQKIQDEQKQPQQVKLQEVANVIAQATDRKQNKTTVEQQPQQVGEIKGEEKQEQVIKQQDDSNNNPQQHQTIPDKQNMEEPAASSPDEPAGHDQEGETAEPKNQMQSYDDEKNQQAIPHDGGAVVVEKQQITEVNNTQEHNQSTHQQVSQHEPEIQNRLDQIIVSIQNKSMQAEEAADEIHDKQAVTNQPQAKVQHNLNGCEEDQENKGNNTQKQPESESRTENPVHQADKPEGEQVEIKQQKQEKQDQQKQEKEKEGKQDQQKQEKQDEQKQDKEKEGKQEKKGGKRNKKNKKKN